MGLCSGLVPFQIRSRLLAFHPENFHSMQSIEQSIVVIGLDDYVPTDYDDVSIAICTRRNTRESVSWMSDGPSVWQAGWLAGWPQNAFIK